MFEHARKSVKLTSCAALVVSYTNTTRMSLVILRMVELPERVVESLSINLILNLIS